MKTSDHEQTKKPARRRYEAPRIEESGGFERLVLACGHTPAELRRRLCNPNLGGIANS